MNAITQRLTLITMFAAVLSAGFVAQPTHSADRAVRVVQLAPVVVVGKRIPVIQLERVGVTAKRVAPAPAPTAVAQRNGDPAPGSGRV